ncbi:hypothetical protein [Fusobacterium ulcerans]|uniref:hypothetical protein n=1 Tax=Fusobacterium ulcerans TaxID=861 RepID=UPI00241CCD95|nr:hypothetical protein [Fusobacterium ulcerans]
MKKIKLLSILGMIILLFTGCLSEEDRAEKVLQKHLKERYGEEFVIYGMGKRAGNVRRWYEAAVVYPKSYIGTRKENDSYYWGKGFVELNNGMKGGDTYGGVLLNESANEFYGKKLKELFGENYLAVIDLDGYYKYTDFEKEIDRRKKSYEKSPNGVFSPISGGIYIFGRVESDKDREWYRKQIYEFIQFMKETGTFEYVDLGITVIDERELIDVTNSRKYIKDLPNNLDKETWRKERRRLMKKANDEFYELSKEKIKERINSLNKGKYDDSDYVNLLFIHIYSPKYIESKGWNKSSRAELHEEVKEYNVIEDINFKLEWW